MDENIITPQGGESSPSNPGPPPAQQPLPPKQRKSKVQLIIVLTVAFLMLAAAGLWWYFIYNKPAEEQAAQQQQAPVVAEGYVPEHFIQAGNKVSYVESNGDIKDFTTLDEGEKVVEAIEINGKPELRYVKKENTGQNDSLVAYGKIDETGKTELVKLPAGTDGYFSNPILSPDGSTIVVEKSDPVTGQMVELTAITVADGTAKKVYDPSTRGGLYAMVDWAENGVALLQSQSCRQCDGPRLAELVKLTLADGKVASFYKGGAGLGYADFTRIPGSDNLLMFGGDFNLIFELNPDQEYGPYSGYHINKTTAAANKDIEIKEEEGATLVGWTTDEAGLYIAHTGLVKTNDAGDFQYPSGNYNALPPKIWLAKGGSKADVAFDSELIAKHTQITSVFENSGYLYVLNVDTTKDTDGDGMTDTVSRLLRRPNAGGAVEKVLEHSGEYGDVQVFSTAN